MTSTNEMLYRVNENGDADILHADDGSVITRIDANVYPVGSWVSARHEHPDGIVLTVADAESIGIRAE